MSTDLHHPPTTTTADRAESVRHTAAQDQARLPVRELGWHLDDPSSAGAVAYLGCDITLAHELCQLLPPGEHLHPVLFEDGIETGPATDNTAPDMAAVAAATQLAPARTSDVDPAGPVGAGEPVGACGHVECRSCGGGVMLADNAPHPSPDCGHPLAD